MKNLLQFSEAPGSSGVLFYASQHMTHALMSTSWLFSSTEAMFRAGRRAEGTCHRVCVFLRMELPQQLHPFDSWLHPVSWSWDWSYGNDANTAVVRILFDGKKGRLENMTHSVGACLSHLQRVSR